MLNSLLKEIYASMSECPGARTALIECIAGRFKIEADLDMLVKTDRSANAERMARKQELGTKREDADDYNIQDGDETVESVNLAASSSSRPRFALRWHVR